MQAADGIVIERGYLGMEFQPEDLNFVKNYIIKKTKAAHMPVILSTQLMDTMIKRMFPSRAEVCDVSNAVLAGVDCCVLTGETATGPYWMQATEYLSKICYETEITDHPELKYNQKQSMILKSEG
jgi:pyruvate kinase